MNGKVSPGKWEACHGGECTCGLIWSLGADAPIARVLCRNAEEGLGYDLTTVRANIRLMTEAKELYLLLDAVFCADPEPGAFSPAYMAGILTRWRVAKARVDAEVLP